MNTDTAADLPFDWAPGAPGCRLVDEARTPAQMHARATELAVAAMESAASTQGQIVSFRASQKVSADAITAAAVQAHEERNAASHEAAVERRTKRMNVHAMRNAEARAEAAERKAERVAAHEARVEASRKAG